MAAADESLMRPQIRHLYSIPLGGGGKEKLQMEGLIGFGSHFIKTKCAHQRVGESLVKVHLQAFCTPKTTDRALSSNVQVVG